MDAFGSSQEGYWWGELEADTTLESDYILYLHILRLGIPENHKLAKYIPTGSSRWRMEYFLRRPAELNATVKAWVGLRLAGDAANHLILSEPAPNHELGGLEATIPTRVLSRDGRSN